MQLDTLSTSKQISRQRAWLITTIGCVLGLLGVLLLYVRLLNILTISSDFTQDYVAAQALRDGRSIYSMFTQSDLSAAALHTNYELLTPQEFENNHPPFTTLLFVPLTFLPYDVALILWSAFSLLLFFLSGYIVLRELQIDLPRHWVCVLIGLGLCWYPFQAHIGLAQLSLPIVACIIGSWALLRKQRDLAGGALLGVASLIKLFPGLIVLYLLARRRWRAAGAALAVGAAGGLLTLVLVGIPDTIRYVVRVAPHDSAIYGLLPINFSFAGAFRRLFVDGPWVRPLLDAPMLAAVLTVLASLGLLALLLRQIKQVSVASQRDDSAFALICLAMLLISPITWQHIFPILILPFALLLQDLQRQPDRRRIVFGLAALGLVSLPDIEIARMLMQQYAPYRMPWFAAFVMLAPTVGLLLLWWLIWPLVYGRSEAAAERLPPHSTPAIR